MNFSVTGLDPADFELLFALDEAELSARGATRLVADAYPCRIGLRRVEAGEDLLLLNHAHVARRGCYAALIERAHDLSETPV